MKLQITTAKAIELREAMVAAQMSLGEVDFTLAMRLAYNVQKLNDINTAFREQQKKIIETFSKKDGDGKPLEVEKAVGNGETIRTPVWDDQVAFQAAYDQVLNEEFSVDLKELSTDIMPKKIDPKLVAALYELIVDPTPPKSPPKRPAPVPVPANR